MYLFNICVYILCRKFKYSYLKTKTIEMPRIRCVYGHWVYFYLILAKKEEEEDERHSSSVARRRVQRDRMHGLTRPSPRVIIELRAADTGEV